MDKIAVSEMKRCSLVLAELAVGIETKDGFVTEKFAIGEVKLVKKVLEEIIVTNGKPNRAVLDDICKIGQDLTIDAALESGLCNGMTRQEILDRAEYVVNKACEEMSNEDGTRS